ncbi:hypothetical protein E2C01_100764 [Portunus trituberculatus]|uniref:Uncharacterized protein n=1 Tax=Portunus trituberculatus TaxID=210409 RepID=A0A5B7K8W3_PORTR|nr:hypothetical protein [Portunus trituberculatus]
MYRHHEMSTCTDGKSSCGTPSITARHHRRPQNCSRIVNRGEQSGPQGAAPHGATLTLMQWQPGKRNNFTPRSRLFFQPPVVRFYWTHHPLPVTREPTLESHTRPPEVTRSEQFYSLYLD